MKQSGGKVVSFSPVVAFQGRPGTKGEAGLTVSSSVLFMFEHSLAFISSV